MAQFNNYRGATDRPFTKRELRAANKGPQSSGLRIGHLNVNGLRHKINGVQELLEEHDFDILAITEAKLTPYQNQLRREVVSNDDIRIEGYRVERLDRDVRNQEGQGGGGIVVYAKDGIHYTQVKKYTEAHHDEAPLQYIHMKVTGPDPVNAFAVYLPPQYDGHARDARVKLLDKHSHLENVVMLGDFNIDLKGEKDNKFVGQFDQLIENYTRIHDGAYTKTETRIDHIYTNSAHKIAESGVVRIGRRRISDHDLIYCTVKKSSGVPAGTSDRERQPLSTAASVSHDSQGRTEYGKSVPVPKPHVDGVKPRWTEEEVELLKSFDKLADGTIRIADVERFVKESGIQRTPDAVRQMIYKQRQQSESQYSTPSHTQDSKSPQKYDPVVLPSASISARESDAVKPRWTVEEVELLKSFDKLADGTIRAADVERFVADSDIQRTPDAVRQKMYQLRQQNQSQYSTPSHTQDSKSLQKYDPVVLPCASISTRESDAVKPRWTVEEVELLKSFDKLADGTIRAADVERFVADSDIQRTPDAVRQKMYQLRQKNQSQYSTPSHTQDSKSLQKYDPVVSPSASISARESDAVNPRWTVEEVELLKSFDKLADGTIRAADVERFVAGSGIQRTPDAVRQKMYKLRNSESLQAPSHVDPCPVMSSTPKAINRNVSGRNLWSGDEDRLIQGFAHKTRGRAAKADVERFIQDSGIDRSSSAVKQRVYNQWDQMQPQYPTYDDSSSFASEQWASPRSGYGDSFQSPYVGCGRKDLWSSEEDRLVSDFAKQTGGRAAKADLERFIEASSIDRSFAAVKQRVYKHGNSESLQAPSHVDPCPVMSSTPKAINRNVSGRNLWSGDEDRLIQGFARKTGGRAAKADVERFIQDSGIDRSSSAVKQRVYNQWASPRSGYGDSFQSPYVGSVGSRSLWSGDEDRLVQQFSRQTGGRAAKADVERFLQENGINRSAAAFKQRVYRNNK